MQKKKGAKKKAAPKKKVAPKKAAKKKAAKKKAAAKKKVAPKKTVKKAAPKKKVAAKKKAAPKDTRKYRGKPDSSKSFVAQNIQDLHVSLTSTVQQLVAPADLEWTFNVYCDSEDCYKSKYFTTLGQAGADASGCFEAGHVTHLVRMAKGK